MQKSGKTSTSPAEEPWYMVIPFPSVAIHRPDDFVVVLGEQQHLRARPALHIGRVFITATQLGKGCCI